MAIAVAGQRQVAEIQKAQAEVALRRELRQQQRAAYRAEHQDCSEAEWQRSMGERRANARTETERNAIDRAIRAGRPDNWRLPFEIWLEDEMERAWQQQGGGQFDLPRPSGWTPTIPLEDQPHAIARAPVSTKLRVLVDRERKFQSIVNAHASRR